MLSCLFRICVVFMIRAPCGTSILFMPAVLSSCNWISRLLAMARPLRMYVVTAPPLVVLAPLIVAPNLQPCLAVRSCTNLVPLTGRVRVDIMSAAIRPMGMVIVPSPCEGPRLGPLAVVVRDLFFRLVGTHPVVSLQDPLSRVIRLLSAEFLGVDRCVTTVLNLLTCLCNLLPLGLLVGALQKPLSAWPTLLQVVVDECTARPGCELLFLQEGVGRIFVLGPSRLKLLVVALPLRLPLVNRLVRLRTRVCCLPRPLLTCVRLQVACPLVTTFDLVGRGTLAPKFAFRVVLVPLPLEGVKTSYTELRKSSFTSGHMSTP